MLVLVLVWVFYSKQKSFPEQTIITKDSILEIKSWETLKTLSQELDINYFFLKRYVEEKYPDFELEIGNYEMKTWYKIDEFINSLQNPITNEIDITSLEGWNIFDYDEYLSNKWLIQTWELTCIFHCCCYTGNSNQYCVFQNFFILIS